MRRRNLPRFLTICHRSFLRRSHFSSSSRISQRPLVILRGNLQESIVYHRSFSRRCHFSPCSRIFRRAFIILRGKLEEIISRRERGHRGRNLINEIIPRSVLSGSRETIPVESKGANPAVYIPSRVLCFVSFNVNIMPLGTIPLCVFLMHPGHERLAEKCRSFYAIKPFNDRPAAGK